MKKINVSLLIIVCLWLPVFTGPAKDVAQSITRILPSYTSDTLAELLKPGTHWTSESHKIINIIDLLKKKSVYQSDQALDQVYDFYYQEMIEFITSLHITSDEKASFLVSFNTLYNFPFISEAQPQDYVVRKPLTELTIRLFSLLYERQSETETRIKLNTLLNRFKTSVRSIKKALDAKKTLPTGLPFNQSIELSALSTYSDLIMTKVLGHLPRLWTWGPRARRLLSWGLRAGGVAASLGAAYATWKAAEAARDIARQTRERATHLAETTRETVESLKKTAYKAEERTAFLAETGARLEAFQKRGKSVIPESDMIDDQKIIKQEYETILGLLKAEVPNGESLVPQEFKQVITDVLLIAAPPENLIVEAKMFLGKLKVLSLYILAGDYGFETSPPRGWGERFWGFFEKRGTPLFGKRHFPFSGKLISQGIGKRGPIALLFEKSKELSKEEILNSFKEKIMQEIHYFVDEINELDIPEDEVEIVDNEENESSIKKGLESMAGYLPLYWRDMLYDTISEDSTHNVSVVKSFEKNMNQVRKVIRRLLSELIALSEKLSSYDATDNFDELHQLLKSFVVRFITKKVDGRKLAHQPLNKLERLKVYMQQWKELSKIQETLPEIP